MTQPMYGTKTDTENRLVDARGIKREEESWIGRLRLADANY